MDTRTFRLKWYSVPSLTGLIASVACFAALPFVPRSQGPVWCAVLGVGFFVGWIISMYVATVAVTAADVRVWAWAPLQKVAPREQIQVMHWNSNFFSFQNADRGVVLLKVSSYGWTGRQLLAMAEELGVPLYDHRTMRGFGKNARVGKLVARQPAKTK